MLTERFWLKFNDEKTVENLFTCTKLVRNMKIEERQLKAWQINKAMKRLLKRSDCAKRFVIMD